MPVIDSNTFRTNQSLGGYPPWDVLAVMYFPSEGDVDERKAFVAEQTRQLIRNTDEDVKSSGNVPEAIVEEFGEFKIKVLDLIVSPSLKADLRSLAPEYGAARWILNLRLHTQHNHAEWASLGVVIGAMQEMKRMGLMKNPLDEDGMYRAWMKYNNVSHLWEAMNIAIGNAAPGTILSIAEGMRIQAEADGILNPSTVWKIEGIRPTNWPKRPLQPELVHCFEKSEARRLPGKQEKDIEGITATEIAKRLINALDMNDGTARSRVSRASDVELPRLATEGDIRYARGEALIWIDKQKPARTRDNDADY